jgi:ribose transport system substrate-binding protein
MVHPRRLAVTLVVPALVLVAACGDDAEDTTDDTPAADTTDTAEPDDAPTAEETAAGGAAPDVNCADAEGTTVAFSVPIPDPNFDAISTIIETRLGEAGASFQRVDANLDPGKQISDLQSLVQQGVDVIIVNPVDPNATLPALTAANEAGIPLVTLETTIEGPEVAANVTADVEFAAAEGARILQELVGDGAVGAINGPPFAQVIVRENETFAATAEEIGLEVLDTQVNQQITPDGARQIADAWKQQNPDLAGIWTFNDTSAVGAASAIDDSFAPAIVSINGQPEAIPLVEEGVIHTTFDLQQDKIGHALAYSALAAICGVDSPDEIVVPVVEINADTVGDYVPLADRVGQPFEVAFEDRDGRTFLVTE